MRENKKLKTDFLRVAYLHIQKARSGGRCSGPPTRTMFPFTLLQ